MRDGLMWWARRRSRGSWAKAVLASTTSSAAAATIDALSFMFPNLRPALLSAFSGRRAGMTLQLTKRQRQCQRGAQDSGAILVILTAGLSSGDVRLNRRCLQDDDGQDAGADEEELS